MFVASLQSVIGTFGKFWINDLAFSGTEIMGAFILLSGLMGNCVTRSLAWDGQAMGNNAASIEIEGDILAVPVSCLFVLCS